MQVGMTGAGSRDGHPDLPKSRWDQIDSEQLVELLGAGEHDPAHVLSADPRERGRPIPRQRTGPSVPPPGGASSGLRSANFGPASSRANLPRSAVVHHTTATTMTKMKTRPFARKSGRARRAIETARKTISPTT